MQITTNIMQVPRDLFRGGRGEPWDCYKAGFITQNAPVRLLKMSGISSKFTDSSSGPSVAILINLGELSSESQLRYIA